MGDKREILFQRSAWLPRQSLWPKGCAGLDLDPLTTCVAPLSGLDCLLCFRHGNLPKWGAWEGPAYRFVGTQSVQIIRRRACGWWVVVFWADLKVDPRFPPIQCAVLDQAKTLAFGRARQLQPRTRMKEHGPGDWSFGNLRVWQLGDE